MGWGGWKGGEGEGMIVRRSYKIVMR